MIPCLKAESMDVNKPSSDRIELENLSQITLQPRCCSENVMNVSQIHRNQGELIENEAINLNGYGLIFLSGKRGNLIWASVFQKGRDSASLVWVAKSRAAVFSGTSKPLKIPTDQEKDQQEKMPRGSLETPAGHRSLEHRGLEQEEGVTMRREGILPEGEVKAISVQRLLKNTPWHLTGHTGIHTSRPQQVFASFG